MEIYDAVTFVLQQSLNTLEAVAKIQASPDGSILFFVHSFSITMWDVQTGGLIHTFTMRSKINDLTVSPLGTHIACGSSDGSVEFWETLTKKQCKGFRNKQPVVAIHWLSPQELAVATQGSVHIHNFGVGKATNSSFTTNPNHVWGMVHLEDQGRLMVGIFLPGAEVDQKPHTFSMIEPRKRSSTLLPQELLIAFGQLSSPMLVGENIVCMAPLSGVQLFNTSSHDWTNSPPLLDAATSMAVSLTRNLVVQTKDSVQIFSVDVLKSREARSEVHPSHVYPLGKNHIVCILQPNRRLTLFKSETLREVHPYDSTPPLESYYQLDSACSPFDHRLVAEFGFSAIMQAWKSSTPLPGWTEVAGEDVPLSGLSPECTRIVTVCGSPQRELHLRDPMNGTILASLPLENDSLGTGQVYGLVFDSVTRFYLKVDGPGWHVQIPHDIIVSPSGGYSHTITKGEPEPLSEPRTPPPYTLDANYEWVLDAKSRKICWISPGNVRRGYGGHFWAGLSLIMVGDDGVVRKLSFKEPDC